MHARRRAWAAVAALVLVALVSAGSGESRADSVEFNILQINDVYEIVRPERETLGGLSRVAGLRLRLMKENPNTFAVLAGDTVSPSALGTAVHEGEPLAGRQIIAVLNAAGLDFAAFGNHEFDLKKDQFRRRLAESAFTWISSNTTDALGVSFPGVPRHAILRLKGGRGGECRVGLIALTTPENRADYVRYGDFLAEAREQVRLLRGGCDVLIAVTHLDIAQDRRIAAALPEIHLILGGHEHKNSYECRAEPGRYSPPIAKADANARTAYIHRLAFDTDSRRLTIRSTLVPVDGKVYPESARKVHDPDDLVDSRTREVAQFWKQRAYDALGASFGAPPDKEIARTRTVLDGRESSVRYGRTNLAELLLRAFLARYRAAAKAAGDPEPEAVVFNSGSIRIDDTIGVDPETGEGPITVYDVLRILPYAGRLVAVEVPGDLLVDLLDAGAKIPGNGGFLQAQGIDRDGPGGWAVAGRPIARGQSYRVIFSDYLLKGDEAAYGRADQEGTINRRLNALWREAVEADPTLNERPRGPLETRQALIAYLEAEKVVDLPPLPEPRPPAGDPENTPSGYVEPRPGRSTEQPPVSFFVDEPDGRRPDTVGLGEAPAPPRTDATPGDARPARSAAEAAGSSASNQITVHAAPASKEQDDRSEAGPEGGDRDCSRAWVVGLAQALAWPVAVVVLALPAMLLFRGSFGKAIEGLREISLGQFRAILGTELEDASLISRMILPTPTPPEPYESGPAPSGRAMRLDEFDRLRQVAEESARAAVLGAWRLVDAAIRDRWVAIKRPRGATEPADWTEAAELGLATMLREIGRASPTRIAVLPLFESLSRIYRLVSDNPAKAARALTKEAARAFIDSAERLVEAIAASPGA